MSMQEFYVPGRRLPEEMPDTVWQIGPTGLRKSASAVSAERNLGRRLDATLADHIEPTPEALAAGNRIAHLMLIDAQEQLDPGDSLADILSKTATQMETFFGGDDTAA